MLNKKVRPRKFFKKFTLLFLAAAVGLGSGATFMSSLNPVQNSTMAAGVLYTRYDNQTQHLIDGNNMIEDDNVMNAKMNSRPREYFADSVDLSFVFKKENIDDLHFYLFPQEQTGVGYKEYFMDSETKKIHLTVSDGTSEGDLERMKVYEVHVYRHSMNSANFVGKAKFVVIGNFIRWGLPEAIVEYPLIDAAGNPIVHWGYDQVLTIAKAGTDWVGDNQVMFTVPTELFPYDARSIKVVFFASDPEKRRYKTINIDKYMVPFYQNENCHVWPSGGEEETATVGVVSHYPWLIFAFDPSDLLEIGGEKNTFEAHFYLDDVIEGKFLFKAVNITLPAGE